MRTLRALEARYQEWCKGRSARMARAGVSSDIPTPANDTPTGTSTALYRPLFETPEGDEAAASEDDFGHDPLTAPYINLALAQY